MLFADRRSFLSVLTSLIGAIIAAILAVPGLGYVFSPLRRRSPSEAEEGFYDAGSWNELAEGAPQLVAIEMTHQDGWAKTQVRHSIWVLKTGTKSTVVLSPICPHLGCPVNWNAAKAQYACPCHASFFNKQGEVLSGPAPRGLDSLPYEIRNGRLFIRWIDFRQGTASREPVTV
jgi:menaquinol-cytochrome c reductase iron-sulfur subunit